MNDKINGKKFEEEQDICIVEKISWLYTDYKKGKATFQWSNLDDTTLLMWPMLTSPGIKYVDIT